ncbi:MFS transporter [Herbiconiux sp. SYSU D00978]|uniref:MFS transporter n=1 Tax=Herbiconiux sp. SYSU D00978 TaxID=2812562 RepID=UPI001A97D05E|nr:MFS transporter [Herbiconiux sp. SYSU D00978]
MRAYISLLRSRALVRIMASQLTARFPFGMISLAVVMHVHARTGSYLQAGLILSCLSVSQAFSGPVLGRLLGRLGARRTIALSTLLCAAALAGIGLTDLPLWGDLALGAITGAAVPPITSALRALYPRIAPGDRLPALFSLDASIQELIWIVGPVAVTVIAGTFSTTAAIMTAVVVLVVGGAWFVASPELRHTRFPRTTGRFGRVLLHRPVLVATAASFFLIASFTGLEVAVVARFGDAHIDAGLVLATFGLGSMVGGIAFGHRSSSRWALSLLILAVAVFTAVAGLTASSPLLGIAMFLAGTGHAPALSLMYRLVSEATPFSESAEAFGWLQTGSLVGAALGTGVAGAAIDSAGVEGGFAISAALAAAGVLVALNRASAAARTPQEEGLRTH